MTHKKLDGNIEDLRKILEDLNEMVNEDLTLTESWTPIDEFDSDFEGMCWVLVGGVVEDARRCRAWTNDLHNHPTYLYSREGGLWTDEITDIIPLHKPEPPTRTQK